MTRNDGAAKPGEVTRVAAADSQSVIDPNDYWVRSSDKPNNYQFTGDGTTDKKVAAPPQTKDGAPNTYTVTDKDSLWTIASKMVKESDCKDKSDKFKLDVVKGLVEKNKDIKGLVANPDVIKGGMVLKTAPVEELAKLGHGKTLNTHYKPPAEREKDGAKDTTPKDPKNPEDCPPGHHRHHGGRRADAGEVPPAGYDQQYPAAGYDRQYPGAQRPMDMGPVKDILGMFGAIAGGALLGDRLGGNRWNHGPRGYYDGGYYDGSYGRGYYDNPSYGYRQNFLGGDDYSYRLQPQYQFRTQPQYQYESPMNYSHYGRPQQNYVAPLNQITQNYRIQNIQQQQQQQIQQLQANQYRQQFNIQQQQQQQHQWRPHPIQQQQQVQNWNQQPHNWQQQQQQQQRQQQIQQWRQQHQHA